MAARRSNRPRKATLKANQALQLDDISELADVASSVGSDGPDADFNPNHLEPEAEKDDEYSDVDQFSQEKRDSDFSGNNEDDMSDVLVDEEPSNNNRMSQLRERSPPDDSQVQHKGLLGRKRISNHEANEQLHSRSITVNDFGHIRKDRFHFRVMNSGPEERKKFLEMLNQYYDEPALPSRLVEVKGRAGKTSSVSQSETSCTQDGLEAWEWYYQGNGRLSFSQLQWQENIPKSHVDRFITRKTCHLINAGGANSMLHHLEQDQSIPLSDFFRSTPLSSVTGTSSSRIGWLLYLGEAINCLAWAPNQRTPTQYLAVTCAPKNSLGSDDDSKTPASSAFVGCSDGASIIQIWRFAGKGSSTLGQTSIDTAEPPCRVLTMCTTWGRVMQFKWCGVPDSGGSDSGQSNTKHLGLLALICRDGYLRVLDVYDDSTPAVPSRTVRITQCAFEAKPPATVCTCIAWISTTLIAAGCANGFVAIWDLERHMRSLTHPKKPCPELYRLLHPTYIVELNTCYPSHPHMLLSSSYDGFLRATDIRSPDEDCVSSLRSRTSYVGLEWFDRCLSVICADESCTVKGAHLRLFDHSKLVLRSRASVTCLSTSPLHGSILIGSIDGTTSLINGIRRLFCRRKEVCHTQVWFKNEWRRAKQLSNLGTSNQIVGTSECSEPGISSASLDAEPSRFDYVGGLSRLSSGYRPENVAKQKEARRKQGKVSEEYQPATTLFERESGVTAVCWNPNPTASGWGAAGLGNGLLVVEDLCYD